MSKSYAEPSHLSIGNDKVELKLDSRTGYIRDIFSKETGLHHKSDASGIWPFGLRMGDGYSPDLLRVQIDASNDCADQTMSYEVTSTDGAATLRMTYDNMLTTGGAAAGIKLTVHISVNDGADYFLIAADVENHGKYDITNIFSGWGALHAGAERAKEHFAVPDWSMGTIWDNPCSSFAERDTFGYPTYGNQGNMTAGWMDLYCDEGGIGIGYINKTAVDDVLQRPGASAHPQQSDTSQGGWIRLQLAAAESVSHQDHREGCHDRWRLSDPPGRELQHRPVDSRPPHGRLAPHGGHLSP